MFRSKRRVAALLGAVALTAPVLALMPGVAQANPESDPYTRDLVAGRNMTKVGEVSVWNDATNLHVTYRIVDTTPGDKTDDWQICGTHLAVETNAAAIPQVQGNAVPGQFEFKTPTDCAQTAEYTIPLSDLGASAGTSLAIAAHADVKVLGGLAGLEYSLPATATMSVTYPVAGGEAYFPNVTISNAGFLNGIYDGWCVDTDHVIYQNQAYNAQVFSSYESLPAGVVEHPENFDLVNWVLNQQFVGKTATNGTAFTYGDVQRAVWTLIDDQVSDSGLGAWSQARVDEILAAARATGEGYTPPCNGIVGVVFVPASGGAPAQVIAAQSILAELGIPCQTRDETAWGSGTGFKGKDWSMYFEYTVS